MEAATRIIDQEGLAGLTTNRIAEVAGISIGTLYQYFKNKQQILSTLGEREVRTVTAKMIATLSRPDPSDPVDQAQVLIRAVFSAFGGRSRVHRILLEHTLAQGNHERLHESPR
ncbi:MAG: helix-turn-helix transcriptional regulator [Burkholderiaceae bacterium]|nr:helix-turn-helix transcriptional regulator [Burkholderiaceae bacterium]